MNTSAKSNAVDSEKSEFQGYSMEELKHERALLAVRKEFARAKVADQFSVLRNPGGKKSESDIPTRKLSRVAKMARKVFPKLNVLDYALVGLSVAGSAKKIYNVFRKR